MQNMIEYNALHLNTVQYKVQYYSVQKIQAIRPLTVVKEWLSSYYFPSAAI